MKIRPLQKEDWQTVRKIYQQGMDTGIATFETQVPDWEIWNAKFLEACRLVADADGKVVGWAALSPTSKRAVYQGVVEVTIYVDLNQTGKRIGTQLMSSLVKASEEAGFWTLQSSIFSENKSSIKLHQRAGFRIIGTRDKIAKRGGIWKDTVFLERRSNLIH